MDSKKLIYSKTFWSDLITIGVAIVELSDHYFGTHVLNTAWYGHVLFLAGVFGIYGRKTADTKIEGLI